MATDNILRTYGDQSIREDVLGLVEILTARENFFLTNLRKTTAISTIHSTLTDTLTTPGSKAISEAADYTYSSLTTPTRLTNIVEFIAEPIKVSLGQQWVEHYTGENELARQTTKALINWGNSAEYDIVRSTLTSGASGTAPKMNGIIAAISKSTNTTAHNSGTALTAAIIKGLMQNNWTNSNGETATDLFCGAFLKNAIDNFSGNRSLTLNIDATKRELVDVVDKYQTGFGTLNIHLHRYIQQAGDATGRILGVRPEKLAIAYLKKPYIQSDLAVTGPYTPKAVLGALTLEVKNQDSHFFASGFDID